jgi:LmbE family N-acetylglucosaminyl deacetylase
LKSHNLSKTYFLYLIFFLSNYILGSNIIFSQSSSKIFNKIKKLNFLGSVLYVGAHPDDENTRLISYFSNHIHARTAYLSLTRGDGGQNLIGSDLREKLGVLRTQELLNARKIDGGEQFFTTANDFGYSKHPKETLKIWNKEDVLSQIIYLIRNFKPDIIINRFNQKTPGSTHGHHTSSALLSIEANEKSDNPNLFSDQLKIVKPWKAKRIFYNTSWRAHKSKENFEKINKFHMVSISTNLFDPISGVNNSKIASKSRSQHKSQGFGSSPSLNKNIEYLELVSGQKINSNNIFENIDTSWNKINGGKEIKALIDKVLKSFDFKRPYKSLNNLLKIYKKIEKIDNKHIKKIKIDELSNIIINCLGLQIQFNSKNNYGVPESFVDVEFRVYNPSPINVDINKIEINNSIIKGNFMKENKVFSLERKIKIPSNFTAPFWLLKNNTIGNYSVEDFRIKGNPETLSPIKCVFSIKIDDVIIKVNKQLLYRHNDPVKGEVIEKFEIYPKATVKLNKEIYAFVNSNTKKINAIVTNNGEKFEGFIELNLPNNWESSPLRHKVFIENKGKSKSYKFSVKSSQNESLNNISATVSSGNKKYNYDLIRLNYNHVAKQNILLPNKSIAFNINLKTKVKKVGYIKGAGDKIPESLKAIGISVLELNLSKIENYDLKKIPTIIMGIRAYNTNSLLKYKNNILWNYVKNGGNLIIQYNTSRGLKNTRITPYKINISRDRVTDENSFVKFLNPNHEILNYPNKINLNDFNNWVQERGLYFPNKWNEKFNPILTMNDVNENEKKGSLLVAKYGKGTFVYTGLSFFRQLPKGIPGAYKLFINLISYNK